MKFLTLLALTSAVLAAPAPVADPSPVADAEAEAFAAPIEEIIPSELEARQSYGSTENGLQSGRCGDVVLIFARGSTEVGNMGSVVGPGLARELDRLLGTRSLVVQGVNYAALLSTNYLPGGTDLSSENEMKSMLRLANSRCPNAKIVVGGYSQGAAVVHRGVEDIDAGIKSKIAGAVCFGDTQFRADGGQIPNFPRDKYKVYCGGLVRDTVCDGNLAGAVLLPHLSYGSDAGDAARFLFSKL